MRDHREIGQQLDLFTFLEYAPGCPVWLPKGTTLYNILSDKMRDFLARHKYVEVRTPVLWKNDLWQVSGHWEHYRDKMFHVVDPADADKEPTLSLKPMNCPGHMAIFKSRHWSYRDLPYRIHDQGLLHRNETSGAIGGLTRVKSFCQDDAHIFLAPEQLEAEIKNLMEMVHRVYFTLGLEYQVVLSTRPKDFMGDPAQWDHAESVLLSGLKTAGGYTLAEGEGAFYGPKIDFMIKGAGDREWQTATIQLDFQLPQRFELEYQAQDNTVKTPIVIHRALYGSFERFVAMLLEQGDGYLPVWLSPVQMAILPITEDVGHYAEKAHAQFAQADWRVELWSENGTLNNKIRKAEEKRIPYMVIVGKKEYETNTVTVRRAGAKDQSSYSLAGAVTQLEYCRDVNF